VIYSIDVRIEGPVRDTEVTDRVADAIRNVSRTRSRSTRTADWSSLRDTLDAFSDVLHEQEILDTARRVFLQNSTDEGFDFSLKKQAAFEGVVNFAVGEPDELGEVNVEVRIREPDVEAFIDYVAPETDGAPRRSRAGVRRPSRPEDIDYREFSEARHRDGVAVRRLSRSAATRRLHRSRRKRPDRRRRRAARR